MKYENKWNEYLDNNSGKIVAFYGSSGSGKSTYKKIFVDRGWKNIKSYTTRQPRGEKDKEYNFNLPNLASHLQKNHKIG